MNAAELWRRYKEYFYHDEALGLSLDISRMRFDGGFFERMAGPMTAAFEAMEALEGGAVANPDEGRMVGHYWLRAPRIAPNDPVRGQITEANEAIKAFVSEIHEASIRGGRDEPFENTLLVGIGGSVLGPQLVADALGGEGDLLRPYFLDNTDPDGIQRTLERLGGALDRTLVVVISKSGSTPEPRNGMLEAKAVYEADELDFAKHAVAVTGEGSELHQTARSEGWLATFPMWDWVGGRTSVTSAVGLLPAALQGFDIDELLDGAAQMDQRTRVKDIRANPAALLALMWHWAGEGRGRKDMVILPYKDRLMLLSRYLQQLVMESLGKELDLEGNVVNQGIAVYGNKGSTDQHAYVQQLREGLNNFFATLIEVQSDEASGEPVDQVEIEPGVTSGDYLEGFLLGTREALYEKDRESITITIHRLDARSLGMLIALYERVVGLYASLVGVNAYHQPGVEAGKKAAASVLELQSALLAEMTKQEEAKTADQWAQALGRPDQAEWIHKLLERLAANPSRGIVRTAADSPFETTYGVL